MISCKLLLESCSLKTTALAFSSVRMLPVIHDFWLGYVRTVTVGTTSSMHLLMKPMTDVVYSSMPLEESKNIFQPVLAKQSCSLASGASCFNFCLESGGYNYGQIWRARESFVQVSVCGVKVVWSFFSPLVAHLTC